MDRSVWKVTDELPSHFHFLQRALENLLGMDQGSIAIGYVVILSLGHPVHQNRDSGKYLQWVENKRAKVSLMLIFLPQLLMAHPPDLNFFPSWQVTTKRKERPWRWFQRKRRCPNPWWVSSHRILKLETWRNKASAEHCPIPSRFFIPSHSVNEHKRFRLGSRRITSVMSFVTRF